MLRTCFQGLRPWGWLLILLWGWWSPEAPLGAQPGYPLVRTLSGLQAGLAPVGDTQGQFQAICPLPNGRICVASGPHLLQYDGRECVPLTLPGPALSLLLASDGAVYVGGMGYFGQVRASAEGKLNYSAISQQMPKTQQLGQFTQVLEVGEELAFYSDEEIILYNPAQKFFRQLRSPAEEFRGAYLAAGQLFVMVPNQGVWRYTRGKIEPMIANRPAPLREVRYSLQLDSEQSLIGCPTGHLFLARNNSFEPFAPDLHELLQEANIHHALADSQYLYLLSDERGVWVLDRATGHFVENWGLHSGLAENQIRGGWQDPQGCVWLLHATHISQVHPHLRVRDLQAFPGLLGKVQALAWFGGRLYVGTEAGLFALQAQTVSQHPVKPKSLTTPSANELPDAALSQWFRRIWATPTAGDNWAGGGLPPQSLRLTATHWQALRWEFRRVPGAQTACYSLVVSGDQLLAETEDRLLALKPDGSLDLAAPNPIVVRQVLAGPSAELFELRETAVNRIAHWRNSPQSRELLRGLPALNSLALQPTSTGSLLWLGSEAGVWRSRLRPDGTADKPSQHVKGPSRVLAATPSQVWVHRHDSLMALDSVGRVVYVYGRSLKPYTGDLWACNSSLLVCVQGSGSPWPGRVLVFRLAQDKVAHTDTLWRLRLAQVAFTSAYLDAENQLWVGAYERVLCLPLGTQPIPLAQSNPSFEAFFRGIFRIGQGLEPMPLAATRQPALKPGQHVFQFNFGANDFLLPDGGFFEVELNGSGNWIPVPGTTYTLPLAEGTHQLQVRAVNALGQLSQSATYSVMIPPPWYRTQWFVVLVILGFVGLAYGLYALRVRSIRRHNYELERQVQARTEEIRLRDAELQAQKDELEAMNEQIVQQTERLIESEKMAALGQLVSSVAHEINTPLGAIKSAALSMQENLPLALERFPVVLATLNEAERTLLLGLIERALHSGTKLTTREERSLRLELEQLLETAGIREAEELAEELVRIGVVQDILIFVPLFRHPRAAEILHLAFKTGSLSKNLEIILRAVAKTQKTVLALKSYSFRQSDDAQSFDLADNIDTILTLYSNRLKQGAGVELLTEFIEGVRLVGWPDRLGQVWTNLLDNALYALMKHPPARGPQLQIRMARNGQTVSVSLTDNGPGIPAEIQDKIFQQFYTTKAKGEGTGLGLYICRQIVAEHGGTLAVRSQPGQTIFIAEFKLNS